MLLLTNAAKGGSVRWRERVQESVRGRTPFVRQLQRTLMRLIGNIFARILFWILRLFEPKHPGGSASGELARNAEFMALFVEGRPEPAVLVVMRYHGGRRPQSYRSSVSGSLHARGDRAPHGVTLTHDFGSLQFVHDHAANVLSIQGHRVGLNGDNVVLCEFDSTAALTPATVRTCRVELPNIRDGFDSEARLLNIAPVAEFVADESA